MHILVIEDDSSIRETLQAALEQEGHAVVTSRNALEGLQRLSEGELPSVILVDHLMPGMSGEDFKRKLRAEPRYQKVPVVLMSASLPKLSESEPFLKKPFDLEGLFSALSAFLPSCAVTASRA